MHLNSSADKNPPVFVMNPHYSGVGIARNLYGQGVKIYGLSNKRSAFGNSSRLFSKIYRVPEDAEGLCRRLLDLRRNHEQAPVLFPTRDLDVIFLHQNRKQLSSSYRIAQPSGNAIPKILDKFQLSKIAERTMIPVPKTLLCESMRDIVNGISKLSFPLLMKPRSAYQWHQKDALHKIGARKVILVASEKELWNAYQKISLVSNEVLLQEYIHGPESNLLSCGCYINRKHDVQGFFTAKKLRQNPALMGTGCVVQIENIPEIVCPSIDLLHACRYSGLAEIEFKYDRERNNFFLIEVNPRHWDQHELGKLVGINLTLTAYHDVIGYIQKPRLPDYENRVDCKWIAERELIILLAKTITFRIKSLWQSKYSYDIKSVNQYVKVFRSFLLELKYILSGKKIFGFFHTHDPIPAVLMCIRLLMDFTSYLFKRAGKR